jgi:hypothetical protein
MEDSGAVFYPDVGDFREGDFLAVYAGEDEAFYIGDFGSLVSRESNFYTVFFSALDSLSDGFSTDSDRD